jgi:hypothetical protein
MAVARRRATSDQELFDVSLPGPRTAQRVGWVLLLLAILAAAAGAFGDGPISRASISAPGGVRVDYERIVRRRAPTEIRIVVPSAPMPGGTLALDVTHLPGTESLVLSPAPQHERATARGERFEIATRGEGPFEVALRNVPTTLGRREIRLGIGLAEPVALRQLVLP